MISKEEAIAQFKQILGDKAGWAKLAKSQFVEHLAVFQSWALRDALWKVERMIQEFFLSTAMNKASILAHVEDREYLPRKRTPSMGLVTISNNGNSSVALPIHTAFQSEGGLSYVIAQSVVLQPGAVGSVMVEQHEPKTVTQTISQTKAFLEMYFTKEDTDRMCRFDVLLDIGSGFEQWAYARLFQGCFPDSKVYDEFYAHNAQSGIRFGNGIFGMIPPLNAVVQVDMWLTEGDTTLVAGKPLYVMGDVYDDALQPVNLTITSADTITGGGAAESTEEIRTNLHYWPIYNEKLIWKDDYVFFVRKNHPGIVWLKVWGEEEAEAAYGPRYEFINKIFVSAYKPGDTGLGSRIMDGLASVKLLNRKFEWVEPVFSFFSLSITGKVGKSVIITEAVSAIQAILMKSYGKDSTTRNELVFVKDLYRIVDNTGFFGTTGASFELTVAGATASTNLNEVVCIDMATTTINLAYV